MEETPQRSGENASSAGFSTEELYRRIADSVSSWEYWLDPQGGYVYLSPACESVSGYSREELLADPGLFERLVHVDDRARFEQHIERTHGSERQEDAEIEIRIAARDGSERWIRHRCTPMYGPDGRYLGRWASNENISRYKLAEERLLRLNRELLAVRDCARAVLQATDEKKLLYDTCRIICNVAGYRMAWIGTVEHDEAKTVRPVAWSGVEDGYLASVDITWADTERGRGPTGTAARTGKTVVLEDYASDPSGRPWRERAYQRGYRSSIAIPLSDPDGGVRAVLNVYASQPYVFTSGAVRLLEEVAEDLAAGIGALRARASSASTQ
ncbi:MAG: GAF domain-containing protein [Gaiellaceae bacterium]